MSKEASTFRFDDCARRLSEQGRRLSTIIHGREGEFLALGSGLQELITRIGALSRRASGLAGIIQGGDIEEATRAFSEELERLGSVSLGGSGQASLEDLARVLTVIRQLDSAVGEFKRIVRTLQMLGISTRIESARLGHQGAGFSTLADDVEKLAGKIVGHSASIMQRSGELTELVGSALDSTVRLVETQKGCSVGIFESIHGNLATLAALVESSKTLSLSLSGRMDDLGRHVGEIISRLQFHDIVRQQVEHVVHAMDDARSVIAGKGELGGDEEGHELVAWLGDVCTLQTHQLENGAERFVKAVEGILSSLSSVADNIRFIEADVRRTLGADDTPGGVLARIEDAVSGVVGAVSDFASQGQEIGRIMSSVASTITEMTSFVNDIEEVGSEIELIALNASVKAARTGEEGKALGVLASSIQRLSGDAGRQTGAVSGFLRDISDSSRILQDNARDYLDMTRATELIGRQQELLGTLKGVETRIFSDFKLIMDEGASLVETIESLSGSVGFHRDVERSLLAVRDFTAALTAEARRIVPPEKDLRRQERLRELLDRYTMEAERDVHNKAFDMVADTAEEGPEVELFTEPEGELGDNVELF